MRASQDAGETACAGRDSGGKFSERVRPDLLWGFARWEDVITPPSCGESVHSDRMRANERPGWRLVAVVGAIIAPMASVLWLGLTLAGSGASVTFALVKIVFTIVVVITGLAGIRWATASGSALLIESAAVALWIILKVEAYPPGAALRTALTLAVPLAASGALLIIADGIRAGTWPRARFKKAAGK